LQPFFLNKTKQQERVKIQYSHPAKGSTDILILSQLKLKRATSSCQMIS